MIDFKRHRLDNGLKILIHEDDSTPLTAMNILYDVGSRDEDPEMTGLAHILEHLMFSGSVNIPDYDSPLQLAGGENNAFTNNDITDYYITLPSENIETAFWLESDRMLGLNFSDSNIDIQKKVVTEEFKQRYLNQPYGDVMLILRPEIYKVHHYAWPTIGRDITHIEKAGRETLKDFFSSHYSPCNAIMTIAGNIKTDKAIRLCEKWFAGISERTTVARTLVREPPQTEEKRITVERNVPSDLLYKAWHVCPKMHADFRVLDLLTDILAGGESGRLQQTLVRDKKLFGDINAYLTGDLDPGLLFIYGKVMDGVALEKAEEEVMKIVDTLKSEIIQNYEIEKVRNRFEATTVFANTGILNKAMSLSLFELMGDADLINREVSSYRKVSAESVKDAANMYMNRGNCTTLYYKSVK